MADPVEVKRKRIKQLEVMVSEVVQETPDTATLMLFSGNDALDYKAGHFCTIDPHQFPALARWTEYLEDVKGKPETARAYSLASAPHENRLAITVKEERYFNGTTAYPPLLSPVLSRRTAPGKTMTITGFTGPYTLPDDIENRTDHVVHISAGSGFVPNWSIIKHAMHHEMKLKHTIIYGNKTADDIIYRHALDALAAQHPDQIKMIHCLSREENAERHGTNYRTGRVGTEVIREAIPDPSAVELFVCGPEISKWEKRAAKENGTTPSPRFLETTLAVLDEIGITKQQLHKESYG